MLCRVTQSHPASPAHLSTTPSPNRRRRPRRSTGAMAHDPITLVLGLDRDGSARGDLFVDDGRSFAFQASGMRRWRDGGLGPGSSERVGWEGVGAPGKGRAPRGGWGTSSFVAPPHATSPRPFAAARATKPPSIWRRRASTRTRRLSLRALDCDGALSPAPRRRCRMPRPTTTRRCARRRECGRDFPGRDLFLSGVAAVVGQKEEGDWRQQRGA